MKEDNKPYRPSQSPVHKKQRQKNWAVCGILFGLFFLFYVMSIAKLRGY